MEVDIMGQTKLQKGEKRKDALRGGKLEAPCREGRRRELMKWGGGERHRWVIGRKKGEKGKREVAYTHTNHFEGEEEEAMKCRGWGKRGEEEEESNAEGVEREVYVRCTKAGVVLKGEEEILRRKRYYEGGNIMKWATSREGKGKGEFIWKNKKEKLELRWKGERENWVRGTNAVNVMKWATSRERGKVKNVF